MGSRDPAVMGLESRAVIAQVAKLFVTIFSETCNKYRFYLANISQYFTDL